MIIIAERRTMQKEIIYSSLCRLANHPTADAVFEHVHHEHPSISRATVYRVLNQLAQKGRIMKININNGADCFDHQTFEHHHMRCSCCGSVYDMPRLDFSIRDDYLAKCKGFLISGYTLQFDGVCPSCREKGGFEIGQ